MGETVSLSITHLPAWRSQRDSVQGLDDSYIHLHVNVNRGEKDANTDRPLALRVPHAVNVNVLLSLTWTQAPSDRPTSTFFLALSCTSLHQGKVPNTNCPSTPRRACLLYALRCLREAADPRKGSKSTYGELRTDRTCLCRTRAFP